MRNFFFYSLAFIVSLGVLSVLLPVTNVGAASQYDDFIKTTPDLRLLNTACEPSYGFDNFADLETNWTQFTSKEFIENGYNSNDVNYPINFSGNGLSLQQYADSFVNKTNWSVSQFQLSPNDRWITITYTTEANTKLEFVDSPQTLGQGLYTKQGQQNYQVEIYMSSSCGITVNVSHSSSSRYAVATYQPNDDYRYKPYLVFWDYDIPEGYEGDIPPDSGVDPELGVTAFNYFVTDKKVKVENKTPNLRGDEQCRWFVDTNPDEVTNASDEYIFNRSCTDKPDYIFTDYGYYELGLRITYPNGLDGVSEQTTWDAYKTLHIDGSTFSGGADVHGDFVPFDPLLETCDPLDIPCHLRNLGATLLDGLKTLFIPNMDYLRNLLDTFAEGLQSQFGFLYTAFEMLVQWLNSLLTVNPDCTVGLGNETFFGVPLSYNFCTFENAAPVIYNTLATTTRLIIAAGFVFVAYRRMIEIVRSLGK